MPLENNPILNQEVTLCIPTLEEMRGIQHHLGEHKLRFKFYLTGMGVLATASDLGDLIHNLKIKKIIHLGIAGSYNPDLKIGEVVEITSEVLADFGSENADGSHISHHDVVPSLDGDQSPYRHGVLVNPAKPFDSTMMQVTGLTVPFATGSDMTLKRRQAYHRDIESMEGAALFYTCLYAGCSFHSIRAISNHVEVRNRAAWNVDLALKGLADFLVEHFL
jgi:futalosine hydrolase